MANPPLRVLLESSMGSATPLALASAGGRLPPGLHLAALVAVPGSAAVRASARGALAVAAAAGNGAAYVVVPASSASAVLVLAGGSGERASRGAFGVTGCDGLRSGRLRAMSLVAKAANDNELGGMMDDGAEAVVYKAVEGQGLGAMDLLLEIVPPSHLVEKAEELRAKISAAVASAKAGEPTKEECATGMVHLAYKITELSYECYPVAGMPPLPKEDAFVDLCFGTGENMESSPLLGQAELLTLELGPSVSKKDAEMIKAVMVGLNIATCSARTARTVHSCCGDILPSAEAA